MTDREQNVLKLTDNTFFLLSRFFKEEVRDLEKYLFEYYLQKGERTRIIEELKKYQNDDSGFGNGLEPDFRQPLSSPMATSIRERQI
jgi:hypothetical protein